MHGQTHCFRFVVSANQIKPNKTKKKEKKKAAQDVAFTPMMIEWFQYKNKYISCEYECEQLNLDQSDL